MRKTASVVYGFFLLAGLFFWHSFSAFTLVGEANPVEEVKQYYLQGMDKLEKALDQYAALAQTDFSPRAIREAHVSCRLAFKEIELFLEYFDKQAVKNHLNGAPLPSLAPNMPSLVTLEPEGLQVLDELVFDEDPGAHREAVVFYTQRIKLKFRDIKIIQWKVGLSHRHIFEASRAEIIRIFTLGLAGFDTPGGSEKAIPEAITSLTAIQTAIQPYSSLVQQKDMALWTAFIQTIQGALDYLKQNSDFDTFDRLYFLKTFVNPLYSQLYRMHRTLGIETPDEVSPESLPIRYSAENIFAPEFLNANYFAKIHPGDITPERIALGKLLFFDPILSDNNQRACASCHDPKKAFTDGQPKSLAMDFNGAVGRNAPTILNSVYSMRWFYDLRLEMLEKQIEHVVFNEQEFNTDFNHILDKLQGSSEYVQLFKQAYGADPRFAVSAWSVQNAITCYVQSLRSFNSPFDRYVRNETSQLSEEAMLGFNLFMGKAACATCHFAPTFNGLVPPEFNDSESEILGVPATKDTLNPELDSDIGRFGGVLKERAEFYKHSFKTVTVRNAALTAPYMHNGVYETLEEVVDFYNKGGGQGMGIETPYQTLPPDPLNLTKQEQLYLVAFMESLTDTTGMTGIPAKLPAMDRQPELNARPVGGKY